jgi:hypothetical protein
MAALIRSALLRGVFDAQQVPFVSHDAGQGDALQTGDAAGQIAEVAARPDADAVHADVHLDDDAARDAALAADGGERLGLHKVIAGDDRIGDVAERSDALQFGAAGEHVRNQDVLNPCGGVDLGFGDFGDRDTQRPGAKLLMRDGGCLMTLGVRPPGFAPVAEEIRHRADVGFHHVEVDAVGGGIEFGLVATDEQRRHVRTAFVQARRPRECSHSPRPYREFDADCRSVRRDWQSKRARLLTPHRAGGRPDGGADHRRPLHRGRDRQNRHARRQTPAAGT